MQWMMDDGLWARRTSGIAAGTGGLAGSMGRRGCGRSVSGTGVHLGGAVSVACGGLAPAATKKQGVG